MTAISGWFYTCWYDNVKPIDVANICPKISYRCKENDSNKHCNNLLAMMYVLPQRPKERVNEGLPEITSINLREKR